MALTGGEIAAIAAASGGGEQAGGGGIFGIGSAISSAVDEINQVLDSLDTTLYVKTKITTKGKVKEIEKVRVSILNIIFVTWMCTAVGGLVASQMDPESRLTQMLYAMYELTHPLMCRLLTLPGMEGDLSAANLPVNIPSLIPGTSITFPRGR